MFARGGGFYSHFYDVCLSEMKVLPRAVSRAAFVTFGLEIKAVTPICVCVCLKCETF